MGAWEYGPYRLTYPRMGKLRSNPTEDDLRKHWGVKNIHRELVWHEFDPDVSKEYYSFNTYLAVRKFQKENGLYVDGIVGRKTFTELIRHRVVSEEESFKIPNHYLYGMVINESGFDPVATGYLNPEDRGLVQINRQFHPDVTDAQAFNGRFALNWGAQRMRESYDIFVPTCPTIAWDCAIAYHHNPSKAREWCKEGKPPDLDIESYVNKIKYYGQLF